MSRTRNQPGGQSVCVQKPVHRKPAGKPKCPSAGTCAAGTSREDKVSTRRNFRATTCCPHECFTDWVCGDARVQLERRAVCAPAGSGMSASLTFLRKGPSRRTQCAFSARPVLFAVLCVPRISPRLGCYTALSHTVSVRLVFSGALFRGRCPEGDAR